MSPVGCHSLILSVVLWPGTSAQCSLSSVWPRRGFASIKPLIINACVCILAFADTIYTRILSSSITRPATSSLRRRRGSLNILIIIVSSGSHFPLSTGICRARKVDALVKSRVILILLQIRKLKGQQRMFCWCGTGTRVIHHLIMGRGLILGNLFNISAKNSKRI